MIVIAGFVLGAVGGWIKATRAGGNRFDRAQYALVFGLICAILAVFGAVIVDRQG